MNEKVYVIEVEGLTKRYGSPDEGVLAVDDIAFQVRQGDLFGFLGPNGAGKTPSGKLSKGMKRALTVTAALVHCLQILF